MPAIDVYRALWRHRRLIAALTLLAAVAAYLYSSSQPKEYEATSLVRIQQTTATTDEAFGSVNSLELGELLAQTYAKIVTTRSMKTRVAAALGSDVPRDQISISATPLGGVALLEITGSSNNPRQAAAVANASATALKQFVTETGTLRDQIVVIDRATTPDSPVAPRPKTAVAIAVMLALLLNCALALVLEFFSDRLPAVDEFEERFSLPVLATVPGLVLRDAPTRARSARAARPDPTPLPAASPAARWRGAAAEAPRRPASAAKPGREEEAVADA